MSSMPTATLAEVQVLRKNSAAGDKMAKPGEAVSLAGRGATFKSQAAALYRKNAVYQRRNWCSNVCLLSAPIFFCLLLFGIQIAINKLLLTGDDYTVSGGTMERWWLGLGCVGAKQQPGDYGGWGGFGRQRDFHCSCHQPTADPATAAVHV